jgi:phosphoribosylformylglycinamidine cyclo-ligase
VSGTDGVGTKIRIARMMGKHDTIGIDAVAMCVNDIAVSGARPLFFLDYLAVGRLEEEVMVAIVKGIAEGCRRADCSLVGGETAEHPGVMEPGDYDIAGFAVGVADRDRIITGASIVPGDVIIGLPSSGIHSNGFSLVRKLFFEIRSYGVDTHIHELGGPLGPVLLEPTRIYTRAILGALAGGIEVHGLVHITGGGFYENIPRILPDTVSARIRKSSFEPQPVFHLIMREGNVAEREMYTTFNMGIGMMAIVPSGAVDAAISALKNAGESPLVIGEITARHDDPVVIE